ncbi:MAG: hypothetical protein ACT4TC_16225 [Myxococcaceae bacterium]
MRVLLLLTLMAGTAQAAAVTVPADVGIGPAGYFVFGPVMQERGWLPHWGLKLNVQAVIDRETIQKNRNRIPAKYQKAAASMDEIRFSPSIFIPDALIISPKVRGNGMYGVTWRPLSFGVPLASGSGRGRLDLSAGLLLTYLFFHSDTLPTTHFIRPGIDLKLEAEVVVTKNFLISLGWAHQFYVPQKLGAFGFGPLNQSIFHVGQPFVKFHFRFPYTANL